MYFCIGVLTVMGCSAKGTRIHPRKGKIQVTPVPNTRWLPSVAASKNMQSLPLHEARVRKQVIFSVVGTFCSAWLPADGCATREAASACLLSMSAPTPFFESMDEDLLAPVVHIYVSICLRLVFRVSRNQLSAQRLNAFSAANTLRLEPSTAAACLKRLSGPADD